MQAIEKLFYDELCQNPHMVFYARWRLCRLNLWRLNVLLICVITGSYVLEQVKFFTVGTDPLTRLGYGKTALVIVYMLMFLAFPLVNVSNMLGIIRRKENILTFAYLLRIAVVLCFMTVVILLKKDPSTPSSEVVMISVTQIIGSHVGAVVLHIQSACILRWITYLKLERTLPIGGFNLEASFMVGRQDVANQTLQELQGIYVYSLRGLRKRSLLGEGHFAKVHRVEMRLSCWWKSRVMAAKEISAEDMDVAEYTSVLVSEIKTLQVLGEHENLVGFIGLYKVKPQGGFGILLEYCENGSLLNQLQSIRNEEENTDLSGVILPQFLEWSKQICTGMDYLHRRKVIHGDLASRNVLLDSTMTCKISDFGMSFKLYTYQTYMRTGEKPLPFRWMPPEVLTDFKFSTASDIWAYGVTLWEIFSLGQEPWPDYSFDSDFVRGLKVDERRLECPELCPHFIYSSVLMKCWELEPGSRPPSCDILRELEILGSEVSLDPSKNDIAENKTF